MTRIYDVVHINNHIYMVDKEDSGKPGDVILDIVGRIWKDMEECFHKVALHQGCFKILATNDSSLNLPLLPQIEERRYTKTDIITALELHKERHSIGYIFTVLTPLPKKVEVEMDYDLKFIKTGQCMGGEVEGYNEFINHRPKVINNILCIKKWIYE